jgi:cobalt/nickel transport system permease protein
MHISDGILSLEVTAVISVISLSLLVKSLKDLKNDDIALVSVASAIFFISSFIHIPFGVTQIHLLLIGVIGILISWNSFLAIFVALSIQALLLGYGGVVSIGVNLFIMALPAVMIYYIYKMPFMQRLDDKIKFFFVGFGGASLASVFLSIILYFSKDEYSYAAYTIFLINIPTMVIEGIVSMFLLLSIKKSYPKILEI